MTGTAEAVPNSALVGDMTSTEGLIISDGDEGSVDGDVASSGCVASSAGGFTITAGVEVVGVGGTGLPCNSNEAVLIEALSMGVGEMTFSAGGGELLTVSA